MNIELRFLQKAIEDKNYINFTYQGKKYQKVKPLKLQEDNSSYILHTEKIAFEFKLMKKLMILKDKFN
jgi:hypothetical protein